MDKPTCKTCAYWVQDQSECRRYPPTVNMVVSGAGDIDWANDFPCALEGEWCGEHPDFPKYIEHRKSLEGGEDG